MASWTSLALRSGRSSSGETLAAAAFFFVGFFATFLLVAFLGAAGEGAAVFLVWKPRKADCIFTVASCTSLLSKSGRSSLWPLNPDLAACTAMAVFTAALVNLMSFRVWKPLKADWIFTVASWTSLAFRSGKSSSCSSFFATFFVAEGAFFAIVGGAFFATAVGAFFATAEGFLFCWADGLEDG